MCSKPDPKDVSFVWLRFFWPEDTAPGARYRNDTLLGGGMAGYLKWVLWIVIAILAAIAMGQL